MTSRELGAIATATLLAACAAPPQAGSYAPTVYPPSTGSQQPSSAERLVQLERLKRLLDNGTLTQREFEAEKARILGTLSESK